MDDELEDKVSFNTDEPRDKLGPEQLFQKKTEFSHWDLKTSSSSTHAKTFYITLADSTFLLLQLVYSTMNSWSHSVQATLRIYPALDSKKGVVKKAKTVSLGASDFHLSKDQYSVETGTLNIDCLDGGQKFHLFYKDDEGGLGLDAIFVVGPVGAFQIGDGQVKFGSKDEDGWVKSKFIPQATCSGSFTTDGEIIAFSGATACAINAIAYLPQMVYQWNFFNLQNDTNSLMFYQGSLEKGHHCQAMLVLNNKLECILLTNKITFHDAELDDFSGYKVPKSITHQLSGTSLVSNKPIKITINLSLSRLLDKIDVLGELPYLVRVFIQTFITAPFCYQWMDQVGKATITIENETPIEIQGLLFNETSFLAEIPGHQI